LEIRQFHIRIRDTLRSVADKVCDQLVQVMSLWLSYEIHFERSEVLDALSGAVEIPIIVDSTSDCVSRGTGLTSPQFLQPLPAHASKRPR